MAGSARASHDESTEEAIEFALQHAKEKQLCKTGDNVVAPHHAESVPIIKNVTFIFHRYELESIGNG
ncbi:pyruvate kinase, cytosolic isozyme [Tanacetum coccineum]|uniref:Pyruvate kinase, cytosolic isozyme n=1 Tax=Tanacetum coccineum TaxID=301880 RepID=A0ABQ4X6I6_9ASTR